MTRHSDSERSGEALIPVDSAAGRILVTLVAILCFLASLSAGLSEQLFHASHSWNRVLAQEITLQIPPVPLRNLEADTEQTLALIRTLPGIFSAEPVPRSESEKWLEPWFGNSLILSELPVPRLIAVRLDPAQAPDIPKLREALSQTLSQALPHVVWDDHRGWRLRLSTMAEAIVALAFALVGLVTLTAALATALATRAAMATHRDIIDILSLIGAQEDFIARLFQKRFGFMGFKGSVLGASAAILVLFLLPFTMSGGHLAGRDLGGNDPFGGLFTQVGLRPRTFIVMLTVPLAMVLIAAFFSRWSVRQHLEHFSLKWTPVKRKML
jgi:cell division transport system permease protein